MELEQVKAAWQREKSMYPSEIDPEQMVADVMRRAMEEDRKFAQEQKKQILWGLLAWVLIASRYKSQAPLLGNLGLAITVLGIALMLSGSIILKYRMRVSHPELPPREYLAEQRKKIAARIAIFKRNIWILIPTILGFAAYSAAPLNTIHRIAVFAIFAVLAFVGCFWFTRRKMKRDLLPLLEGIDREIADLENE
jgi:uncharacterized membrane protein (DUF485 family)